jgi:cytochrome P450
MRGDDLSQDPTELPTFPFARTVGDLANPPGGRLDVPVSRVRLPTGRTAWLVTRHADVRQMLRSGAFSSDMTKPGFPLLVNADASAPMPGFFLAMDPPEHTRFRQLLAPEFMLRHMRRLEPLIVETVTSALDAMRDSGPPADLVTSFALPVPSAVICHLLGVPYADHEFFQKRSQQFLSGATTLDDRKAAIQELRAFLAHLVGEKKRAGSADDLLGRLAVTSENGGLTADESVGAALLLLIAGHESTAQMIGLGTLTLLDHPDEYAALRTNPQNAADTVEELLRYLTIFHFGALRVATADVEIGGQAIKAGDAAIALLSAANHDASVFSQPDTFDIQRGAQQHMAFGFGIHQCIGQPLARFELRVALTELARRVPDLALALPAGQLIMRSHSIAFGPEHLPVTW